MLRRLLVLLASIAALLCLQVPVAAAALPDITVTAERGATSAVVDYEIAATWTCNPPSGSEFQVGDTGVICSRYPEVDAFQVHVLAADDVPPILHVGSDITVDATSGDGAVVTYDPPSVSDDRPGVGAPVCAPSSGSTFPVGLTPVNCSVRDAAGNVTSRIARNVTVNAFSDPIAANDAARFTSRIGRVVTPVRPILLRSGVKVPVSCSASCSVTLTLQGVTRTRGSHGYTTRYVRIGGGVAKLVRAGAARAVRATLTPQQVRAFRARSSALVTVRLVVTVRHAGARPIVSFRTMRL